MATKENEKILAEKVESMSKQTLETFVKELKKQNHEIVKIGPGTDGQQICFLASESEKIDVSPNLELDSQIQISQQSLSQQSQGDRLDKQVHRISMGKQAKQVP